MSIDSCVSIPSDRTIEKCVHTAAHDAATNRRRALRFPFLKPLTVMQGGEKLAAFSRDVSPGGLGLVHRQPLQLALATISIDLGSRIVDAQLDVRWCRDGGNGWWCSGGEITSSWSTFFSLVKSAMGVEVELRKHERYSFCHPFTLSNELSGLVCPAYGLDISFGGLRVLTDRHLGQQELLAQQELRIHGSIGGEQLVVRGNLIRCNEVADATFTCAIAFNRLQIVELPARC